MRSLHGVHVHGFPNMFLVQPAQGANLISNVPHNLSDAAVTIATIVRHALDEGGAEVEVTGEAEDAWMELLGTGMTGILGSLECTPGYYNNEGQPGVGWELLRGYPLGATAYFAYIDAWRRSGTFEGLEIRSPA
jgi:cyclohexanone monooxygenase